MRIAGPAFNSLGRWSRARRARGPEPQENEARHLIAWGDGPGLEEHGGLKPQENEARRINWSAEGAPSISPSAINNVRENKITISGIRVAIGVGARVEKLSHSKI